MTDIFLITIYDTTYIDLLATVSLASYLSFIGVMAVNHRFHSIEDVYELLEQINEKL